MKVFVVLFFISCCMFLTAAEKVIIARPANSKIQSIVIEEDSLIIKSKGKTYTFKLSELLNDKTVQTKRPAPENLAEAFKYNGQWFFFNTPRMLYRFKQKGYKVFKKDELLEKVLYKKKYYVRDLNKDIFLLDWKIKKDFSPHFIPAKQYVESLDKKIKSLKATIIMLERKIFLAQDIVRTYRGKYILLLKNNNLTITMLEDAGAYGWSMGIQNFLSFPSCAEVILDKNNFKTTRRKSTFQDLMRLNLKSNILII